MFVVYVAEFLKSVMLLLMAFEIYGTETMSVVIEDKSILLNLYELFACFNIWTSNLPDWVWRFPIIYSNSRPPMSWGVILASILVP